MQRRLCDVQVLRSIQDNITEEDLIQYVAKPQSAGRPAELLPT